MSDQPGGEERRESLKWRRRLIFIIIAVVAISVGVRAAYVGPQTKQAPATTNADAASGNSTEIGNPGDNPLVGNLSGRNARARAATARSSVEQTQDQRTEDDLPADSPVRKILPYLTEGGIAMLIGIALGMATRAVAKIGVILIAVAFIAVQFLAHKGLIGDVNWAGIAAWAKNFVLNISGESGIGAILKHKLPSAGALMMGYLIGLKRG